MKRHLASKYTGWTVLRVIVHERSAARELVLHIRQSPSTGIEVVFPAHAQANPIAARDHDAGGPDFDVKFVHLSGRQKLLLIMRVVGTIVRGKLEVELSMGSPKPSLADRRVRIHRPLEDNLPHVG